MTNATAASAAATHTFELHRGRGTFNALFFTIMGPYIEFTLRRRKRRVFAGLPRDVVEIGSGVGANMRYLAVGTMLVAIEPNVYMHERLALEARRHGVQLELRTEMAEQTSIADHSVDAVISSLVLCSVQNPAAVLAEIRRILRPGGTFRFVEHVVAESNTMTRLAQRVFRRPWAWTFEGCSCERDLAALVYRAGFENVEVERYRIHSPFVTFNAHIAGTATS